MVGCLEIEFVCIYRGLGLSLCSVFMFCVLVFDGGFIEGKI